MKMKEITFDEHLAFLIINTGKERNLATSHYNTRVAELNTAKQEVERQGYVIDVLSDLQTQHLEAIKANWEQDKTSFLRLEHVVQENRRVSQYIDMVAQGASRQAGKLLNESHQSLRDKFEASWEEADIIVDRAEEIQEIHGLRMLGGGWGGNVIAQVWRKDLDIVKTKIIEQFEFLTNEMIITATLSPGVRSL
jgi:galactokinase